jgi:hypothetical protein
MRKLVFVLLAFLIIFPAYAQLKKVALVSVTGNKVIDASDFGLMGLFKTLAKDTNFLLQPIITEIKDRILNETAKDFPFEMLPEDSVINNVYYQQLGKEMEKSLLSSFTVSPPGYYFIPNNKRKILLLDTIFDDQAVDGFMFVNVNYKLTKIIETMGMGTAKVQATINIMIYDTNAKKIFQLSVDQYSTNSLVFALGGNAMDIKRILPLCKEATDKAFIRIKQKLPKHLKKMNKRLKRQA